MKLITATLTISATLVFSATAQDSSEAFIKACKAASTDSSKGINGTDTTWFFLGKELTHLSLGKFWETDYSATVSKADPAPLIIDYHEKLKALGVELLLVPVPAKASIYPEKFSSTGTPEPLAPFYEQLSKAGVNVLDLEPIFSAAVKENPDQLLYCKTDSHYTPYATQLIAQLIHDRYQNSDWAQSITSDLKFIPSAEKSITIKGDIGSGASETLTVVEINDPAGEQIYPENTTSPILLLGDSHTAVFSEGGELHTTAAGLADHLQAKFGTQIHKVGNNASGTHQARLNLLRKAHSTPGYWDTKKLVIWHFTARDFTQAPKWTAVPPKP